MSVFYKYLFFIGCFIFSSSLVGQSLLEDTNDFVHACEILNSKSEINQDSFLKAATNLLAITYFYGQPKGVGVIDFSQMKNNVRDQDTKGWISANTAADIELLLEPPSAGFLDSLQAALQYRQSGKRQLIQEKLYAETALSPANYLSVQKTLEHYNVPPISQTSALKKAGEGSNSDVSKGVLLSQAAIITGMFEFVLDRAKDEVIINFFEGMLGDNSPDIAQLFPTVIEQYGDKNFNYSNSFIERLRQAFYEDLQLLSVRLPHLMLEDNYFEAIHSEPVAFNILAIYSMVAMAQQEAAIEEIMPVTYQYLHQNRLESITNLNFDLANIDTDTPAYQELIVLVEELKNQLKLIYSDFENAENDLVLEVETVGDPRELEQHHFLGHEEYTLEALIGGNSDGKGYDLFFLPQLLRGQLDSNYLVSYNTLEDYDLFFGEEKTTRQWKATGLDLARKLGGKWHNEQSLISLLQNWQKDLVDYRVTLNNYVLAQQDSLELIKKESDQLNASLLKLGTVFQENKKFWNTKLKHDQRLAFNTLIILTDRELFDEMAYGAEFAELNETEILHLLVEKKKAYLSALEDRMQVLDNKLIEQHKDVNSLSDFQVYLYESKKSITPYAFMLPEIDKLSVLIDKMQNQLSVLDGLNAKESRNAIENAKPILQTTEFLSKLMFCLRSNNDEQKWLNRAQLNSVMDGDLKQKAFLGFMGQELSEIKDIGLISPDGLTQFVQLFVSDLHVYQLHSALDSLGQKDSLAFYYKTALLVNGLNRILELPLVKINDMSGKFEPLIAQNPRLEKIPETANQLLDFIYYLHAKEHGRAMSTMIRLFTNLYEQGEVEDTNSKPVMAYLAEYGDFVANLIDAQNGDQVKDLLDHIADPPGSSRTKRNKEMTVSVNAYLGANLGNERWQSEQSGTADEEFFNVAPTMPFGFTVSHLLGKKKRSFSLFISILDLGGLLNTHTADPLYGNDEITFKNVLKPGFQLQWNIPKSPFFIGLGTQIGNQYRNVNEQLEGFSSRRNFISFGVDVPVFTLYQR